MARYEIDGKVVLITGAAQGIGRDTARRLAERGARLALVDRDTEGLESAVAAIGGEAEPFVADVTDTEPITAAIAAARDRFGGIDVCLASAGISGMPKPATLVTPEEFEQVIQVNLLGVWRTLSACLPDVVERQGYLLPIASLAAAVPTPLIVAYGASKVGVHSIGRTLRFELAHTGAKVGVAYFAEIDTAMTQEAYKVPVVDRAVNSIPKGLRKIYPVEVASAAIVRGIERRSRRVCVPRWVSWTVSLNGLGGPFEALAARDPRFIRNLKQAQREAEAEASAREAEEVPR